MTQIDELKNWKKKRWKENKNEWSHGTVKQWKIEKLRDKKEIVKNKMNARKWYWIKWKNKWKIEKMKL